MEPKKDFLGVAALATLAAAFILYFRRRRKRPSQLIIVGNGFDIYHGIPSRYVQFREYLRQQDETVFDVLEKYLYLEGDDEWNHLESNLANLTLMNYWIKCVFFLATLP